MDISIQSITIATLVREHPFEILVRRATLVLAAALLLTYAYLSGISVFHAVMQRSAEGQSGQLKTRLAELEREYFTLAKSIDPAAGIPIGLGKVASKNFVERAIVVGQASVQSGL